MACNLEDGEAGSGWILSISGRVPTIPIYPRIIARQENMETSVPSEPSIDHDMSRNIPPHSGSHHGSHHIMAHGCCQDTQDGSTIQIGNLALSQKRAQRQHADLSVTILRFPFPRETRNRVSLQRPQRPSVKEPA